MTTRYYAGIGARRTPERILGLFSGLALYLYYQGYTLRSGGADGADSAFEAGLLGVGPQDIFLPWKGFNNNQSQLYGVESKALTMAEHYHPAWNACTPVARKFHARNCYQVLGKDLETPADFILCWTPKGETVGGTGQALRIAEDLNIPVINFGGFNDLSMAILTVDDIVQQIKAEEIINEQTA